MSGATAIEQIRQGAARVVRNLSEAHASWQFFWRNAAFRREIRNLVAVLYRIDVGRLNDEHLSALVELTEIAEKMIDVHVSRLGGGVRDSVDRDFFRKLKSRLALAREGFERGLPADPSKRPSRDQLLDRFADLLRSDPINLPDRTDCAPASTS